MIRNVIVGTAAVFGATYLLQSALSDRELQLKQGECAVIADVWTGGAPRVEKNFAEHKAQAEPGVKKDVSSLFSFDSATTRTVTLAFWEWAYVTPVDPPKHVHVLVSGNWEILEGPSGDCIANEPTEIHESKSEDPKEQKQDSDAQPASEQSKPRIHLLLSSHVYPDKIVDAYQTFGLELLHEKATHKALSRCLACTRAEEQAKQADDCDAKPEIAEEPNKQDGEGDEDNLPPFQTRLQDCMERELDRYHIALDAMRFISVEGDVLRKSRAQTYHFKRTVHNLLRFRAASAK